MINQLNITNNKDLPIDYWDTVKTLKNLTKLNFSPDITLIIGPNASGKSTIVNLLKRAFHCSDGYYSCITRNSTQNNTKDDYTSFNGYDIIHDGNPIFVFNPSVCKQKSYFDDDFMKDQLSHMMATKIASSGQEIFYQLSTACSYASKINTIEDKIGSNGLLDKRVEASQKILNNPTIPKSKKTMVFDEPTQHMDFINEIAFWEQMEVGAKKFQFIIVTHSIGILKNFKCDVKIIELQDGYHNKMKNAFKKITEEWI